MVSRLIDPTGPPTKPDLKATEINLMGVLYTTKLAFHYLRRQPISSDRDRCLILKSSLAGYFDLPGSVQYQSSKFGVRGLFRTLRNTSLREGIRVNLVAPWSADLTILNVSADIVSGTLKRECSRKQSKNTSTRRTLAARAWTIVARACWCLLLTSQFMVSRTIDF